MKKVMKFVKGKREEEIPVKNVSVETKKVVNEKVDETSREDDFISRDKSITKLHKAVWNENSDKLKSIIKTHDIDITDKLDRTALYFAVLKNNPNIVNLLLENSANQNIPDIDGITPFLKSVQLGYKQCAANLLSCGADIKKTDKDSNSCLHFAVLGKQSDMLSFLLEHNADSNVPNVNGEYPLHIAIQMQDKQMVELLLTHNVDINVVNNFGLTPQMLAEQKNLEIVEMLENYSLKNSKENNLFPDEISHKSSYENVNIPKIDQKHSSKLESDGDTWNDSPVTTPTKKHEKPVTKFSKFFNEEIEITEEKSESDVSVKCSENTSPQSGIIPPPCKPLRSLEYLQSGMAMENRPVHLLTLGTVRTRHISMTESDHSKNNTPHRYSYQGDLQAANGDSFQKLPDHFSTADEKGDSVNISVKSKLLSKLECDSTIQSDWGSNESLPLDELSVGGKKEKSVTSCTSKNNSNNSNSGSIRDKSTDIFLQKQFSLLEDYEKNREKRCSVSYEMDLVTVKMDKNKDNVDGHFDDIGNLLEDNNRINTQLEKYAGQTDTLVGNTKSKSLPRSCEPYNSYHKGSFSLPRTLESGKDPFREMRSYGYFKPRSHFSFSLKMLRGDKKTGFIDKLKSMFNKKSQIHLTEQSDNGTWLYKKTDNEYYSSRVEGSFSGSESVKKGDNLPTSKTFNNFSDLIDFDNDSSSNDPSFSNNEQNKVIEKKILSLNNMSHESSHSRVASCSSSSKCANEDCTHVEEDLQTKYKSLFSVVKKPGPELPIDSIFCEECSDFVNQKLNDAEQSLLSKENFIHLLQEQLEQLKDRNIKSINEAQEVYYQYGVAQQDLLSLKHICAKYDDELQKLRAERFPAAEHDQVASKLKEEAEKWKKQYEDLATKVNLEGSIVKGEESTETVKVTTDEEKWRSIIQNEVTAAVNILKENSQGVISSLEKQNKKLETMVEKLQKNIDASAGREEQLQKDLQALKNKLSAASVQSDKIRNEYDKNYEDTMKPVLMNNEKLKADLEKMSKLYADLQRDYEENVNAIENDLKKSSDISEEFNIVKDEYRALTRSLSSLSEEIVKAKENALAKNEELRQQVAEMGPATNMKQFINKITESLESIELTCACKPDNLNEVSEQVTELNNSIADVEKINKLNSDIELKISEVKNCKRINCLQEENKKLKEDMIQKCDNLILKVKESGEELELMSSELKSKNDVIENQCLQICNLSDIIDNEKQKNEMLECDIECAKREIQIEKTSNIELSAENEDLKLELRASIADKKSLEEENISIKSSLGEMEKINEDLNQKLQEAITTINEMKEMIQASQDRMEKLEKANQELKETVDSLKNAESEFKQKEYEDRINKLIEENKKLKEQLEIEKDNIASLKKHIDSLQFYHENEMKANNIRLEELQTDSNTNKFNLHTEIDKLNNMNVLLQQKLNAIEDENKQLQNNITELNDEITALNDKLQNTDILQDPQKYVDALDAINQENIEMKSAMHVLREILEVKLGEKVDSVTDLLESNSVKKTSTESIKASRKRSSKISIESPKQEQIDVNLSEANKKKINSCKKNCGERARVDDFVVQRENNTEKNIEEDEVNPENIKETIKSSKASRKQTTKKAIESLKEQIAPVSLPEDHRKSSKSSQKQLSKKSIGSSKEEQIATLNLTEDNKKKVISCKRICGGRAPVDESVVQKVNSSEKNIDEIVDEISITPENIKDTPILKTSTESNKSSQKQLSKKSIESSKEEQIATVNLSEENNKKSISSRKNSGILATGDESVVQKVNSSENNIDEITDEILITPKDIKETPILKTSTESSKSSQKQLSKKSIESSKEEQIATEESNKKSISSRKSSDGRAIVDESVVQKVNSSEKNIDEIVDKISINPEDIKETPMSKTSIESSNSSQKQLFKKSIESLKEEQTATVNLTKDNNKKVISCKQICGGRARVDKSVVQEVNSIEKKLDEIVDDISMTEDIKATSMPNLDDLGNNEIETPDNVVEIEEEVNIVNDLLESNSLKKTSIESNKASLKQLSKKSIESSKDEQIVNNNVSEATKKKITSCKQICNEGAHVDESIVQRVNSIEKKIDEIVDNVSITSENIKATSMPNLDDVGIDEFEPPGNVVASVKSASNNIVRKSSSLECITGKAADDEDCCDSKWEKHLEFIHKLRSELTEILAKIDEKKEGRTVSSTESTSKHYTDKYKEVITSIQRQINELQEKSVQENNKSSGLEEELKGIKGQISQRSQMEDELYRLRKELYRQKVERIKDTEVTKIKKEAEKLAVQQQIKFQYLENKQKLLLDLAAVQNALQVKNEEENKIKQKCDALVKEVTANQEARKKKLLDISLIRPQSLSSTVKRIVIFDVPGASHQVCKSECSVYPEKPVKPHALVINARKKLNTLEKHRLSTESVPEQSSSDEELKKKYLLL